MVFDIYQSRPLESLLNKLWLIIPKDSPIYHSNRSKINLSNNQLLNKKPINRYALLTYNNKKAIWKKLH